VPNWITINIDTLKEAKVAALIEACDSAALGDDQGNRAAGIIQGVVDEIRRKIASCKNNRVDADTATIPKGLRDLAVDLIIARLKTAIEQPLSEAESRAIERRVSDLNRIADCKDVVEQPDDAVEPEVERGGSIEVITKSKRVARREDMEGLL
jgi:hypothetical protein